MNGDGLSLDREAYFASSEQRRARHERDGDGRRAVSACVAEPEQPGQPCLEKLPNDMTTGHSFHCGVTQ